MDIEYWEKHYSRQDGGRIQSLFSEFVLSYLQDKKYILELGCGNGRDALFLKRSGFNLVAIDQVTNEIDLLNKEFCDQNIQFVTGDFTHLSNALKDSLVKQFDCIYSRFTLHSVTSTEEQRLLADIPCFLKEGGILAIEARGLKNSLCGKGKKVEEDDYSISYIHDNHYRRFIDFNTLCKRLEKNFEVIYAEEGEGFAPYNGENDVFFRIIAKKR